MKKQKSYLPRNVDSIVFEIFDEVRERAFFNGIFFFSKNYYNCILFKLKKSFNEDEMIAFVKFPLPKSLFDGIFLDEWIPLSGKLGEQKEGYINIRMLFTVFYKFRFYLIIFSVLFNFGFEF